MCRREGLPIRSSSIAVPVRCRQLRAIDVWPISGSTLKADPGQTARPAVPVNLDTDHDPVRNGRNSRSPGCHEELTSSQSKSIPLRCVQTISPVPLRLICR